MSLAPAADSFFVNGDPVAQGSLNVIKGRIFHVKGARLNRWRKAIADAASERGLQPHTGAVAIDLEFVMRRPKAHYTRGGAVKLGSSPLPVGRPDLDKLVRAVLDALTGVAWLDDAQVTDLAARKYYEHTGEAFRNMTPGVWIGITYR